RKPPGNGTLAETPVATCGVTNSPPAISSKWLRPAGRAPASPAAAGAGPFLSENAHEPTPYSFAPGRRAGGRVPGTGRRIGRRANRRRPAAGAAARPGAISDRGIRL